MTYNPWSLRNKVAGVMDLIVDNNVDICCVQETFLRKSDGAIISEIKDRGYKIHSYRKSHYESHGGGVAVIYKQLLQVDKISTKKKYASFENLECLVKSEGQNIRIVNIYRTPSTSKYYHPMRVFKEEFTEFTANVDFTAQFDEATAKANKILADPDVQAQISSDVAAGSAQIEKDISSALDKIPADLSTVIPEGGISIPNISSKFPKKFPI